MFINAYYFQHHMYTLVPRHVREDMEWMADKGTQAVSLAVLEQDLYASCYNIEIVCREAERVGMEVHAVPSRWAGLTAGAPKVPSMFSATHPHTWILDEHGKPAYGPAQGPRSSVHYTETFDFFCESLNTLLKQWPIKGVIWDELKSIRMKDYSAKALKAVGREAPIEMHVDAVADFFNRVSAFAKSIHPELNLSLFLFAHYQGYPVERCASIANIDDFGCDGRPWDFASGRLLREQGSHHKPDKVLLGQGERFLDLAQKFGKRGLFLIENHDMRSDHFHLMDQFYPEILELGAEHIIYYYYPRNVDQPDEQMEMIGKHLKTAAKNV